MNQLAHQIVVESVGDAEKLTPKERSAIARKAAAARWEPGAVRFRRDRKTDDDSPER